MQYDETDFDFLQRLLARDGLFCRFEAGEEATRMLIHDASDGLPAVPGVAELRYHPRSGTAREGETLFSLGQGGQLLPAAVQVKDYHADTPELPLEARAGGGGHGQLYRHGDHVVSLDQSRDLARRQQQALDVRRLQFVAETDCRGLAPGYRLKVSGHPEEALNADYLIVEVSHEGDQGAGLAYGDQAKGMSYRNRLTLIPIPRPPISEPPPEEPSCL